MRVISGTAGGRMLKTVSAPGLRPAMGKTREALFSMLEAQGIDWPDCSVLDLYAGCGSLALECVSRGAPLAWLVDNSRDSCSCIQANIAALDMSKNCRLFDMDVLRFLRAQQPYSFNIVFIDPPYRRNLASSTLALLVSHSWLAESAFVICEVEKNLDMEIPAKFALLTERNFGQTSLYIWNFQ